MAKKNGKTKETSAADQMLKHMGPAGGIISNLFRRMGIAEQLIAGAKIAHPRHVEAVDGVFKAACPPECMRALSDTVYEAHVAELIMRAVNGESPKPATNAEIMAALSAMSFKAPLGNDAQLLYERLFAAIFPREAERFNVASAKEEFYPGSVGELEAEMRRKCGDSDRLFGAPEVIL